MYDVNIVNLLLTSHLIKFINLQIFCLGYALGSVEGRVAIQYVNPANPKDNFTFKCHRSNGAQGGYQDIYAVSNQIMIVVILSSYLLIKTKSTSSWHLLSQRSLLCINTFALHINNYNAILPHHYRHSIMFMIKSQLCFSIAMFLMTHDKQ